MSGSFRSVALSEGGKLIRPKVRDCYPRLNLFERMDARDETVAFWISGPAGSGKTTLTASYVEERGFNCLWYNVDASDADPFTFFFHLGQAGKKAAPRRKKPLPLLTPEYLLGLPGFATSFFTDLFLRLKPPAVIVFDNLHAIPDDAPFYGLLAQAFSLAPEGLRFLLTSRRTPPQAYSRLALSNNMAQLAGDDLNMQLPEIKDVAAMSGFDSQPEEFALRIYNATDGWAAGVRAFVEVCKQSGTTGHYGAAVEVEELFEHCANELFRHLPGTTQDFLLKTVWLPEFSSKMAMALTAEKRSGRILASLHRNNIFTERRFSPEPVYRYHALFRHFLTQEALARFSSRQLSDLKLAAAQLLLHNEQLDGAVGLFAEEGQWDRLSKIILTQAPKLFGQGRIQRLLGWLKLVPEEWVNKQPWLLYWYGSAFSGADPDEAERCLGRAFELFVENNDVEGAYSAWAAVVNTTTWRWKRMEPLDPWLERYEELLTRWPQGASSSVMVQVVPTMLFALMLRRADYSQMKPWEEKARKLLIKVDNPAILNSLRTCLIFVCLWKGDFARARWVLNATHTLDEINPVARIIGYVAEVKIAVAHGDIDKAYRLADEGIALAAKTGLNFMDISLYATKTYICMSTHDLEMAETTLEEIKKRLSPEREMDVAQYHALSAWRAISSGDSSLARNHARTSLEMGEGCPFAEASAHIALAAVAIESKDFEEAHRHIDFVKRVGTTLKSSVLTFPGYLLSADLAFTRGRDCEGLKQLEKGLAFARETELFFPYYLTGEMLIRLLQRAFQEGIETEYASRLVQRLRILPKVAPVELEAWPWPVRLYCFGRFQIVRGGQSVRPKGKAQKKPLSLLKLLVSLGGREISPMTAAGWLWPDADMDLAVNSLNATVHRLRKLLGDMDSIVVRDGRISINERLMWVDSWAFQRQLRGAGVGPGGGQVKGDEAAATLRKAIDLYRGKFLLGDMDEQWAIEPRERLHNRFLTAVEVLGEHLEADDRWKEALSCYRSALDVDLKTEKLHRGIMVCCQRLGRRSEGLNVYRKCKRILGTYFGELPSPKTEKVRQALIEIE